MRVLAAMSGGVDSAVAAARAVAAGHDVVGVHLALSADPATLRTGSRGCCSREDAGDARRVADLLGIPFYVWDFAERFRADVIDDFVDSYALAVPQEFTDEMGALLEETRKNLNFSGELSKEQAQLCALSFLETCFGGDTSLPLDSTAKGTTYQYATVAALALRYYGIPARYVEGFTVKTAENENVSVTDENVGAWVEVYQDGIGWLPLALTPGLESLAPEQTESGIKPVGAGEGEGSGPRVTEGQEPEQDDAEQSEDPDNTPDFGQRTGLLAKPAFWILLIAGILLLFVLFILIRHHIILKNRQKTIENPDNSESISSLFSDAAKLLSALGFDRNGGSMLTLYGPISGRFGEETANAFRAMVFLNEQALFSSKAPDDPEREMMRNFHGTVLNLLKTNTKWPKRLRLKWLNCLY